MKDQYFGDINDYRKYGLLRALGKASGLSIGVCWLRTESDRRKDGEFRRYLQESSRWRPYDSELYDKLRKLLRPNVRRSVLHAETWKILPQAKYQHSILSDSANDRHQYFAETWNRFRNCPVIFFDPDNGLEVNSVRFGRRGSAKYVYWCELKSAYDQGHSLVVYQHFPHESRDKFINRIVREIKDRLNAPIVDSFRTAYAVFFLVAQKKHVQRFENVHEVMVKQWGNQIHPSAHVVA